MNKNTDSKKRETNSLFIDIDGGCKRLTPQDIREAERELGLGAIKMALALNTPYETFKFWKSGRSTPPGVLTLAIALLKELKGTKKGKKYGV